MLRQQKISNGVKKILPWLVLVIFATLAVAFSLTEIYRLPKSIDYSEPITSGVRENRTITIILVGDIMLDRGVEYMVGKEGKGDFRFPFLKIANELKGAELLFGNLEGPISDMGEKVGSIYSFRNKPEAIEALNYAGFNVISLANNHAFDYGREALEDTFLRLKTAGVDEHSFISTRRSARVIDYVGAGFNEKEAYSPIIKEVNGSTGSPQVKIGFLAYTNLGPESWKAGEKNSGIAWISDYNPPTTLPLAEDERAPKDFEKINPSTELRVNAEQSRSIKKDIENAKSQVDILIVSLHSGEEYQKEPTQFQIDFSKMAIDAGADIVIGHHPHVIQRNEKYNEGWIFYSLGNFVFDQNFSEETMQGQILKVLIESSKIEKIIPMRIKLNNSFQPEILE